MTLNSCEARDLNRDIYPVSRSRSMDAAFGHEADCSSLKIHAKMLQQAPADDECM